MSEQIVALADEREEAWQDKYWRQADELADEIEEYSYSVEDACRGPKVSKQSSLNNALQLKLPVLNASGIANH